MRNIKLKIVESLMGPDFLRPQVEDIDFYIDEYSSCGPSKYGLYLDDSFELSSANVTKITKEFKGLTHLIIAGELKELGEFSALSELEYFQFEKISGGIDFKLFPKLEEIRGVWTKKLLGLSELKSLKSLYLRTFKPTSKNIEDICFPNLKSLELNSSNISSLNGIEKCINLENLEVYYCNKLVNISAISECSQTLSNIHFQSCKNIEDFNPLSNMRVLEKLDIETCGVINSISFIKSIQSLVELYFAQTTISDGNLLPISEHSNLKEVYFNNKKHYSHKLAEIEELIMR